jgi:hypothetical protein
MVGRTLLVFTMFAMQAAFASEIEAVLAHPPVDAFFFCIEHGDGVLKAPGSGLMQRMAAATKTGLAGGST